MATRITKLIARDIRFPTSQALDGSDAMNVAPDYSATYVVLETDAPDGLSGHGLTFTIGRGNEICVTAARALAPLVVGMTLEEITANMGAFWHHMIAGDSQLRWIGPEKAQSISQRRLSSIASGICGPRLRASRYGNFWSI